MKTLHRLMHGIVTVVACFGLLLTASSCDKDFDLSDISKDMTLGGSMSVPIGVTDTLRLSRLIETTSNLKIDENGVYALTFDGTTTLDIDPIEDVTIKGMSTDPVTHDIDVPTFSGTVPSLPISANVNATLHIDATQELPKEVEELYTVGFYTMNTTMHLRLSSSAISKISNAHAKNFKMKFPDLINFDSGISGMDYSTNTLTINQAFDSNGEMAISLPVSGYHNLPPISNHKMHIAESVICSGTFEGTATNVTSADLKDLSMSLSFDVPDVEIDKVTGIFDPNILIQPEVVSLGKIPNILNDESTEINLNNICLKFDIANLIGVPFNADLTLRGIDKNEQYMDGKAQTTVHINEATKDNVYTHLLLTNSETYSEEGYTKELVPSLANVVKKVPSKIELSSDVAVDKSKTHSLQLGQAYSTTIGYNAYLPFDFGKNSHFVYRDSITGVGKDMKNISKSLKDIKLGVNASIHSTLPFDITITIIPRDDEGNTMENFLEYTDKVHFNASTDGSTPQYSDLSFAEKTEGAFGWLDTIEFIVEGDTNDATAILKPTQYVLLELKALLPNGITIKQ